MDDLSALLGFLNGCVVLIALAKLTEATFSLAKELGVVGFAPWLIGLVWFFLGGWKLVGRAALRLLRAARRA